MSELVGRDVLHDARGCGVALHVLPETLARHRSPVVREEDMAAPGLGPRRADLAQVVDEGLLGKVADGHHAAFVAFAVWDDEACLEVEGVELEQDELGDAETRRIPRGARRRSGRQAAGPPRRVRAPREAADQDVGGRRARWDPRRGSAPGRGACRDLEARSGSVPASARRAPRRPAGRGTPPRSHRRRGPADGARLRGRQATGRGPWRRPRGCGARARARL